MRTRMGMEYINSIYHGASQGSSRLNDSSCRDTLTNVRYPHNRIVLNLISLRSKQNQYIPHPLKENKTEIFNYL